jgi:hypothetical protein
LHHIIIEEFGFSVDDDFHSISSNFHPLSCLIENDKQKNMLSQGDILRNDVGSCWSQENNR